MYARAWAFRKVSGTLLSIYCVEEKKTHFGFYSVLTQFRGLVCSTQTSKGSVDSLSPIAIQAAWRLGRWDELDRLTKDTLPKSQKSGALYHISFGKAITGILHRKPTFQDELNKCRGAVMERLSAVAGEGYVRAYPEIIRLHCLREIEDAQNALSPAGVSIGSQAFVDFVNDESNGCWNPRLDHVSPVGASEVLESRLALSRISESPALEGSLFLTISKRARKQGRTAVALTALTQAESVLSSFFQKDSFKMKSTLMLELAKLKHDNGETSEALQILGLPNLQSLTSVADCTGAKLIQEVSSQVSKILQLGGESNEKDVEECINIFSRHTLKAIKWSAEGGLAGSRDVLNGYQLVIRLSPKWEKAHFEYAKYLDTILNSRAYNVLKRKSSTNSIDGEEEVFRKTALSEDTLCQRYATLCVQHHATALTLNTKHLYESLPRMLSLWLEFTSLADPATMSNECKCFCFPFIDQKKI